MIKLIDRIKTKFFGISLIIIGVFIPSILYPFITQSPIVSITKHVADLDGIPFDTYLGDYEIVILGGHSEDRFAIPYIYYCIWYIILCYRSWFCGFMQKE